ncbi:semaphorin-3F-like [Tachyglossus aculeatus]|uniref:semaphorin-3F-like n=1 Tax=Tachyglossus aculeatus TaxID=9261 RepID=UPI0018F3FE73|nr:semaphorin-3F-like [Tachyglossus aculeatus]
MPGSRRPLSLRSKWVQDFVFYLVCDSQNSGLGSCSYSPLHKSMATFMDGNLYTGIYVNFIGSDPAIFRATEHLPTLRSDRYNSFWLNAPEFLKAFKISDSINRNDDKLYFFFREKAIRGLPEPTVLALVGRVCLNDIGGRYPLINKWTTFRKGRLLCFVTEKDGRKTFVSQLQDVFIHPVDDKRDPLIYGIFTTPRYSLRLLPSEGPSATDSRSVLPSLSSCPY